MGEQVTGRVFSVNIGRSKGVSKEMVRSCVAVPRFGIEGDAHAGPGLRQVSLLSVEEIEKMGCSFSSSDVKFKPGIFAENITTSDLDFLKIKVGDTLMIGKDVVLRVTQIGKECHGSCAIMQQVGRCIMPEQGIFAVVEKGGDIFINDSIVLETKR